jgi:TonB family protein
MRRSVTFATTLLLFGMGLAFAQTNPTAVSTERASLERKVLVRTEPNYPELARKVHLQGAVKVEVIVRPNGTVKSTRVLGGNPVLADAATEAVTKWKFESGPNETMQLIEVMFTAH